MQQINWRKKIENFKFKNIIYKIELGYLNTIK
jgi:hypothetical protein